MLADATARIGAAESAAPIIAVADNRARDWTALYRLGGIVAFMALACMLLDIALTMLPGWGSASVPAGAAAWFEQFVDDPILGMRNLDFLNACVSLLVLPMYLAVYGALRRSAPALALLGLIAVSIGTALFVAANSALPMLELSQRYAVASDPATRASLFTAADALLARGAHGSYGSFPGFFLSELGTLCITLAMLRRGGAFSGSAAWVGTAGAAILLAYTAAYTFGSGASALIMAVAIPGGLLMIGWHAMVGRTLLRLHERTD